MLRHIKNLRKCMSVSQGVGPVTPLQILPTNGPDDLYTIQNNNLKLAAKLAFSISPTSSAQPALPENQGF